MQVELDLPDDVERRIRTAAARCRVTTDDFLTQMLSEEFSPEPVDTAAEIQAAIDSYEAGGGVDGETFFRELRQKYNLPERDAGA